MEYYNSKLTNRQHYSEADEDDITNEISADERRHYSESDEDGTANEIAAGQRRHYAEADEDVTADAKGEIDFEKFSFTAAGIETKIENYQNIRFQRRHFPEAEFDEVTDVTAEKKSAEAADTTRADEEIAKIKEAARIEKKIVEDWEGKQSDRRHFPGSTTSHIFNKPFVA